MGSLLDVLVKKPKYSNKDLSFVNRFTAAPGLLYPVWRRHMLPGDHFRFFVNSLVNTYPTIGSPMGSFKAKIDYFFVPWRLYVKSFRDNRVGFTFDTVSKSFKDVSFPYLNFSGVTTANGYPNGIRSDSIAHFIGFPKGFKNSGTASIQDMWRFNAFSYLGYLDIFRNYYCNPQEEQFYGLSFTGDTGASWTAYKLSELSDFIDWVVDGNLDVTKYTSSNRPGFLHGMLSRTYLSDYFTAWISSDNYTAAQVFSRIRTNEANPNFPGSQANAITVDQLRYASKVASYVERGILSDRYGDWTMTQFGVSSRQHMDIPEYIGSTSFEIKFQDVITTAETSQTGNGPAGSTAGMAQTYSKGSSHSFKATEYGTIMAIFSIIPRVDYYQGVWRDERKLYLTDCYSPAMAKIGMQPIFQSEAFALDTYNNEGQVSVEAWTRFQNGFAYHPAWTEYTTAVNEVHGHFADNLRYWTLTRDFRSGFDYPNDISFTSYINPSQWNYIFADTAPDAQNFRVQLGFNVHAKRPMPKQLMPSL